MRRAWAVGVLMLAAAAVVGFDASVAVIDVAYMAPEEVMPIARSLLSPEGRISFDARTHALVVVDRPAAVARIRDMLARLDRPAVNLVVQVRRRRPAAGQADAAGLSGRLKAPGDEGRVDLARRRRAQAASDTQRVVVASGAAAYIASGVALPAGAAGRSDGYRQFDTGLMVTPVLRGDHVVVRVASTASAPAAPATGAGHASSAATEVRLPLGRWVEIGGILAETDARLAEILRREGTQGTADRGFWIRVDRTDGGSTRTVERMR